MAKAPSSQSTCETCTALRGTIDSIMDAIGEGRFSDGLVTADQYVRHRLGTAGHLYHIEGFMDIVKERDQAIEERRIYSHALSLALKGNVRDISAAKDALIKRAGEDLDREALRS